MKRLLCIWSSMNAGGVETFLMKVYRKIDRSQYQIDFCVNVREECFYDREINALGGKIFYVPSKSENTREFRKQLAALIRREGYEYVLRVTSNAMGFMDLKIAKNAGARVCSARSSNSSDGVGMVVKAAHLMGRLLYGRYVDVKIAPSDLAAVYTFGNKAYQKGDVAILNNAVDLDVFHYSNVGRDKIRAEFSVDDSTVVIGHIGRFMTQKNHPFLIRVFAEIHKQNPNTVLMLVGSGKLEDTIKSEINGLGLTDSVIFTGVRSDVPDLLSAMDVFVMPSLFEGMPNTVIEAQATGLPCVIADTITKEANITGLVEYLPLEAPHVWAQQALEAAHKQRADTQQIFRARKYDIESTVNHFIKLVFRE